MSSKTRIQLEEWLKTIEVVSGRVLDIGGSQLPVIKRLMNTAIQWDEYRILDLEHPHTCKQQPNIIQNVNIPEIYDSKNLPNYGKGIIDKEFDVIFCLEVTEYLWNPVGALELLNDYLKSGGILYISFHFIYPVHNPPEEDYLRYTPRGAVKLLEEAGFEIIKHTYRTSDSTLIQGFYSEEGMRPAKKHRHDVVGSLIKAVKK